MSNLAIRLNADPVLSLDYSSIVSGYTLIGILSHPARILFIQNYTDETLMFSWDGVNDAFPLPTNGFLVLDITTNKSLPEGCYVSTGQPFYVKYISMAPSGNSVYISSFYGYKATV